MRTMLSNECESQNLVGKHERALTKTTADMVIVNISSTSDYKLRLGSDYKCKTDFFVEIFLQIGDWTSDPQ